MKRIIASAVLAFGVFGSLAEAQTHVEPNMFSTMTECKAALKSGDFRFYEPQYFGLRVKNPVNGEDRVAVPLESNLCLEMQVVGGRQFVVQREGTMFRARKLVDGSLALYARDDCGNPVYGVVFPPPPMQVALVEPELVPEEELPPPVVQVPARSRRESRPVLVVPEKKKRFGSGKKVLLIAGALVGGGYAAYYYWPCPPGTVRKR